MFVIIMDVLKYCFGIDPARKAVTRIPPKKKPQQAVIIRFTYADAPTSLISDDSVSPNVYRRYFKRFECKRKLFRRQLNPPLITVTFVLLLLFVLKNYSEE